MTDASMAARFSETDFRVGRVLNRSVAVMSHSFFTLVIIAALAYVPVVLAGIGFASYLVAGGQLSPDLIKPVPIIIFAIVFFFVFVSLTVLTQAMIVHAAFQDMRRRPVRFSETVRVGLSRFFPVVALAIIVGILAILGFLLLVFPALIFATMFFVATPACVVEQCGPFVSMRRSAQLTKGHRWKVLGLMMLLILISFAGSWPLDLLLGALGGPIASTIGSLIWNAIWSAFYATSVAVAYHDLRVAKEGIDIEQIASVFD